MKQYIAEILGTFALTFAIGASLAGHFAVATPVIAGLVLGLFVYSISHVSGTHINPAVTIGIWSLKKIDTIHALLYIVSQFIGALFAFLLIKALGMHTNVMIDNSMKVVIAELIGAFFFTFGIASVVFEKTPKALSGVVIGGSLLLGIALATLIGSNGVLNPAVALGIGSFGIMYILGPIVGSLLGMQAYKYLVSA